MHTIYHHLCKNREGKECVHIHEASERVQEKSTVTYTVPQGSTQGVTTRNFISIPVCIFGFFELCEYITYFLNILIKILKNLVVKFCVIDTWKSVSLSFMLFSTEFLKRKKSSKGRKERINRKLRRGKDRQR